MSKKLLKVISIGISVWLVLGLGDFILAAEKLTPDEWNRLSWQDKIKAKKVIVRVSDYDYPYTWMEEKNLDVSVTTLREKIHSGDLTTPLQWYNVALFETLHPDVYIKPVSFYPWQKEAISNLTAMMAAGNAPSVFRTRGADVAITSGYAADITDLLKDWDQTAYLKENYWGLWKRAAWYNGRCYGILFPCICHPGLYYRKDRFKEAGIFNEKGESAPPENWTWNDLREISKKLADPKRKKWGISIRLIRMLNSSINLITEYANTIGYPITSMSLGESWVIPDKSGKYTWRFGYIPQIAKAIKFFHDMRWEDNSLLYGPLDGTDDSKEFIAGRTAMYYYQAVRDVFMDAVFRPHKFGEEVESKDIEGCCLTPTSSYGIKLNNLFDDPIMFDPTISKEQLKAAFDWACWNRCGEGYILNLRNSVILDKGGIKVSAYQCWQALTTPYKVEFPSDVKMMLENVKKQSPEEYWRVVKKSEEKVSIPTPTEYGLRIDPAGLMNIVEMEIGLLLKENLTMDDIKAEMEKTGEKINRKILNYKIKGDKEKFKAYVAALDEFYKKNFPKWYNSKEYKEYMEEYWKVW